MRTDNETIPDDVTGAMKGLLIASLLSIPFWAGVVAIILHFTK